MTIGLRLALAAGAALVLLTACGDDSNSAGNRDQTQVNAPDRRTVISTINVEVETVEVVERSIGQVSSRTAPSLIAEVDGRITAVHVDTGERVKRGKLLLEIDPEPYALALASARADVRRLEALVHSQGRQLERQRQLLANGAVTQGTFDTTEGEYRNLQEQLEGARIAVRQAELDLRNTRVTAPVDAEVDERMVSVGDFSTRGQPLFRLVSQDLLRVRLPFPETVGARLAVGQTVRMHAPLSAADVVEGSISELRPGLMGGSRAVEAIINVANPGSWRDGGSVSAEVVLDQRESVVVPNQSVVQRPEGQVVYLIEDGTARAQKVRVGVRARETVEILEGLEGGETIAVDSAGFLTDGADVQVSEGGAQ
ncbi:MAG: efflux RND transporter periplasmic adaptor subunit [Hydrogenophaga sp.]|tara:strand:+ start:3862 stop:4968 length:1107 start_codon:yes stop_codon:yes gene_type:complete